MDLESLHCLVVVEMSSVMFGNPLQVHQFFTPAVSITCIDDIVQSSFNMPSFYMLCKQLKDHSTVAELANFWLLDKEMTIIW